MLLSCLNMAGSVRVNSIATLCVAIMMMADERSGCDVCSQVIAPAVPSLCRELLHLHIMQSVVNVSVCYSVPAK